MKYNWSEMCREQSAASVVVALFLLARVADGYPGGGPDTACNSLYPAGHGAHPQTGPPPYGIRPQKKTYRPGETIPIVLESLGDANYFRGVYVQTRSACDVSGRQPIGVFTYPGLDLQTRHCFDAVHSTITHTSREKKDSRTVYWTAPVMPSGHVVIRATFVKDVHTFWINVFSETLRDLKDPVLPGCVTENTTTSLPSTDAANRTVPTHRHFAHVNPASTNPSRSTRSQQTAFFVVFMSTFYIIGR